VNTISKEYFGRHKTGGRHLSAGIAYQDLVCIQYLFEHMKSPDFEYITFESDDDFTLIFKNYEMYVQVKKEKLTDSKIKTILKNKNEIEPTIKQVIVASEVHGKLKNAILYLKNASYSKFKDSKKFSIHKEFQEKYQVNNIPLEVIENLVIEEIPESKLIKLVKYTIYEWAQNENLEFDIEGLFDNLISNISLKLRSGSGHLSKQNVIDVCLKFPRKKGDSKNNLIINSYWANDDVILQALKKYSKDKEKFVTEIDLLILYIKNKDYINVEKKISEYYKYMPDFELYKLWVMHKMDENKQLLEFCNYLIGMNKSLQYAYYFKSLSLMKEYNYNESLLYANKAYSINNTFEINLILAKLYYLIGDTLKSREHYEECLKIDFRSSEALVGISALLPVNKACEFLERSIRYNPDYYPAYLEKGKILRYSGKYKNAVEYFNEYLTFDKNSKELYKELSLCLINLRKQSYAEYMVKWLEEFLYKDLFDQMVEGEIVLITDITMDQTNIITFTKSGDDFRIISPISEFILVKDDRSFITIGCIIDSFLKMSKELLMESDVEFENGYEYVPSIMNFYQSEKQFRKMLNSFSLENNSVLNKNYSFIEGDEEWDFKEYICNLQQLEVNVLEFNEDVKVAIQLGEGLITGEFSRSGKGYFNFCSKIENPTDFSEFILVLECKESREKIHIKTDVKAVKIKKKPLFVF